MTLATRLRLILLRGAPFYRVARLGYVITRYAARKLHEPDFAGFARFGERRGLFLDVGANVGQSALSFRLVNRAAPILSIEPNTFHSRDLAIVGRIVRNFHFLICAAGEEDAVATLYVPTLRGVPITGEASLVRSAAEHSYWLKDHLSTDDARAFAVVEQTVDVRRLDGLRLEPSFVKIDVEGAELAVLRGLSETLERSHPVLLVERSRRAGEVCALLGELGYAPYVYEPSSNDFVAYGAQQAQNLFFVHRNDPQHPVTAGSEAPAAKGKDALAGRRVEASLSAARSRVG